MTNGAKVCATVGLACAAVACALSPAFGRETWRRPVTVDPENIAVLGAASPKESHAPVISVRDPKAALRNATDDTYDAAGLVQDPDVAWFVDDLPDSHTFGTGPESAGINLISEVDTLIMGTDVGPGVPDTNLLQVNYFTEDSSDIVPAGILSPVSTAYISWRLDVGTGVAGTDKINWTPNPGFTVMDSGFCLASDGLIIQCFSLAVHDSDANGVSGIGVAELGVENIAGFGVDELIMYWEIQLAPSCGDGHVDAGEQCDDGNTLGGDGCSATCQNEGANPGDLDGDGDVDLADFAEFLRLFNGPN